MFFIAPQKPKLLADSLANLLRARLVLFGDGQIQAARLFAIHPCTPNARVFTD
jgi:hypothetical protein